MGRISSQCLGCIWHERPTSYRCMWKYGEAGVGVEEREGWDGQNAVGVPEADGGRGSGEVAEAV